MENILDKLEAIQVLIKGAARQALECENLIDEATHKPKGPQVDSNLIYKVEEALRMVGLDVAYCKNALASIKSEM